MPSTTTPRRGRPRSPRPGPLQAFGRSLQSLREAQGLSVAQLAEACDVSPYAVWAWEAGRSRPLAPRIRRLAVALGVPADSLLAALYP